MLMLISELCSLFTRSSRPLEIFSNNFFFFNKFSYLKILVHLPMVMTFTYSVLQFNIHK